MWKATGSSHKQEGGALAGRGEGILVQLLNKHTLQALKTVRFYILILRDDTVRLCPSGPREMKTSSFMFNVRGEASADMQRKDGHGDR